jgi:hypothetical protein
MTRTATMQRPGLTAEEAAGDDLYLYLTARTVILEHRCL